MKSKAAVRRIVEALKKLYPDALCSLQYQKDAGLSIIAMHTGGEARRGDLSDKFITPVFNMADYAIVVSSGDSDGMMNDLCAGNGIPMDKIDSISDVVTVLPAAFK